MFVSLLLLLLLLIQGASEIILRKCSFIIGVNGKLLRLNMIEKNKITQKVLKVMALNGLRTICLAYVDYIFQDDNDDGYANNGDVELATTKASV